MFETFLNFASSKSQALGIRLSDDSTVLIMSVMEKSLIEKGANQNLININLSKIPVLTE